MVKNYKFVLIGLMVSCSLLKAMITQPKKFDGVLRIENLVRKLACTCIVKNKYPFEHKDNTIGSTLIYILKITKDAFEADQLNIFGADKIREIEDSIMIKHCKCMNDKNGNFDPEKIPFEIDGHNSNGIKVLKEIDRCMKKNLASIVPILKRLDISPNTVMPEHIFHFSHNSRINDNCQHLGSSSYYSSIIGYFVYHAIMDGSTKIDYYAKKNEPTKIDPMQNIFLDLLNLGGRINEAEKKQLIYKRAGSPPYSYSYAGIKKKVTDCGYILNTEEVMKTIKNQINNDQQLYSNYGHKWFYSHRWIGENKKRPYIVRRQRLCSLTDFYNEICDSNQNCKLKKIEPPFKNKEGFPC